MSKRAKTPALLRALQSLLPASDISIIHERPWHSLTFSGTQLCLSVALTETVSAEEAAQISATLSEHAFDLPGQFVADIEATHAVVDNNLQCLLIDSLLLDD